jgi:hypothetical protein
MLCSSCVTWALVFWVMTLICRVRTVTNLYVEVPGVVLIMCDAVPGVVCENCLHVTNLYVEVRAYHA